MYRAQLVVCISQVQKGYSPIDILLDTVNNTSIARQVRISGTEPVNVLGGYRYQDGLGYYQTKRDTPTHFFTDHLPRDVYVFE